MKTLTLNLDDRLYEILNRYSEVQLIQALKNYAQNEAHIETNGDENFGTLFDAIKEMPKATYDTDLVEIQQKMRDEWSNRKAQILAFSGSWADEDKSEQTPVSKLSFEEKRKRFAQLAGSWKGDFPECD